MSSNITLLVRFGPDPGSTEDADGNINAVFTGIQTMVLSPEELDRITDSQDLYLLAASVWKTLTEEGHGHMLIGICEGFKYTTTETSCAERARGIEKTPSGHIPFEPVGYRPLLAVARYSRSPGVEHAGATDIAMDYRGENPTIVPFDYQTLLTHAPDAAST